MPYQGHAAQGLPGITGPKNFAATLRKARSSSSSGIKASQVVEKRKRTSGQRAPRLAAVPKTLPYPQITARNPIKISREEKIVGGVAAYSGRGAAARAFKQVLPRLTKPLVRSAAAAGSVVGTAAIGGLAAYYVTTALLNTLARKKEERAQNAFQASQAYRRMREEIVRKQRRPMNSAQHRAAAAAFQRELLKLGLSSRDLTEL